MNAWRRSVAVVVITGAAVVVGFFGFDVYQDARFARAEEQVENAREQLARVEDLATVFRHVGEVIEPSVVNIRVTRTIRTGGRQRMPLDEDMLRRFFPEGLPEGFEGFEDGGPQRMPVMGQGSGVIMEVENGYAYIVTNHHVVSGGSEIRIELADGRTIDDTSVVGSDPRTDIAVIRIRGERLIAAQWGDSDALNKGDWVLAFGSPFGWVGSMTHGIVSAMGREVGILHDRRTMMAGYEDFIQTDAAINPGNSGGPLVNIRGEVIGINTAIASRTGGFMGIGFAIPSNQARMVYDHLREHGRVVRGWLGVGIDNVDSENPNVRASVEASGYERREGVYVDRVFANTPAYELLQPEDIVTAMNGEPVRNVRQLRNRIAAMAPGTEVTFDVFRDGETVQVNVQLGEQPDDPAVLAQTVRPEVPELVNAEQLGVQLQTVNRQLAQRFGLREVRRGGAIIMQVEPGSLAEQAGLRPGEMITRVNNLPVTTAEEANEAITEADLAEGIRLHVSSREGARLVVVRSMAE